MPNVTLTTAELISASESLNQISDKDWNIKTGYKISKVVKALQPHVEEFQEQRQELVNDYAKKDDDGNPIPPEDEDGNPMEDRVQIEDQEGLNEDLREMLDQEVEVQIPVDITIDDLDSDSVAMKPNMLQGLLPIIDAGEDEG